MLAQEEATSEMTSDVACYWFQRFLIGKKRSSGRARKGRAMKDN
jgi:hypothetical protein